MRHASPAVPAGGPRERCPFSDRVGGASIRILNGCRRAPEWTELVLPRLELVTASDIYFSCLCILLGKEVLSTPEFGEVYSATDTIG